MQTKYSGFTVLFAYKFLGVYRSGHFSTVGNLKFVVNNIIREEHTRAIEMNNWANAGIFRLDSTAGTYSEVMHWWLTELARWLHSQDVDLPKWSVGANDLDLMYFDVKFVPWEEMCVVVESFLPWGLASITKRRVLLFQYNGNSLVTSYNKKKPWSWKGNNEQDHWWQHTGTKGRWSVTRSFSLMRSSDGWSHWHLSDEWICEELCAADHLPFIPVRRHELAPQVERSFENRM